MTKIIEFLSQHKEAIVALIIAIYEFLARIVPTSKSVSILTAIIKVLNFIVPDRRKNDTLVKSVTIGLLMLASVTGYSQLNSSVKSVRFYNADSTTVRNEVNSLQGTYGNVGALYYNALQSKFRIFYDSAWHDLTGSGGGGGGTLTGADNGLSVSSNTVKLGGNLLQDTSIPSTDKNFSISGNNTLLELNQDGLNATNFITTSTNMNIADGSGSGLILQSSSGGGNGASIVLDDFNMTFQGDAVGFGGAKYAADYSTFYDARSLTDKNYVDNHYTAGNSLTKTGGVFSLGGTMNGNVSINSNASNTNSFIIGGTTRPQTIQLNGGNILTNYGNITINDTQTSITRNATNPSSFVMSSTGMVFSDLLNNKGVTYAADYSANFTTESLITKRYTDARLASKAIPTPAVGQTGQSIRWNNSGNTWEYFTASGFANNTDINQLMVSQGAGTSSVNSDLEVTAAGSLQFGVAGNTAGATRTLNAAGSDTDIAIQMTAKGAGGFNVTSGSFNTSSGNVTLGSSSLSGTIRNIDAAGSGSNVGLFIRGKGTSGFVQIYPNVSSTANVLNITQGSYGFNSDVASPNLIAQFSNSTVDNTLNITHSTNTVALEAGDLTSGNAVKEFIIRPNQNATTTAGSNLQLRGGQGGGGTSNGGNLTLSAGTGNAGGTNGNIIILNLPTSSAGLPSGALWNNAGVLSIAP